MSKAEENEKITQPVRIYCAPMEGVTGYVFRNVHHRLHGGIDKYFSPFLSPMQKRRLKSRDKKDVAPENNEGFCLVPQILTNHAGQFLETVEYLEALGYTEMNLNLGCPSPTVVTKGKGAGFLAEPEELDTFFDEVFEELGKRQSRVSITVKSRLGMRDPDEFFRLLEIYQSYPVAELILHPRVQKDLYKNPVNLEAFAWAMENCRIPLCYNGDLFTVEVYRNLRQRFPKITACMLGRGLVADPGLPSVIRGENCAEVPFSEYADALYKAYVQALGNRQDAVYHMKEIWAFKEQFVHEEDKRLKKIRKAKNPQQYEAAVYDYFHS